MNFLFLRCVFFLLTILVCALLFFKNDNLRNAVYEQTYSAAVITPRYDARFYIDKASAFNIIISSNEDGLLYSIFDPSIDDYNSYISYLHRIGIFPAEFELVQGDNYGKLRINSLRLKRYEKM